MDQAERLQRLEKLMEELQQENLTVPVLVEGKRDVEALRNIGLEGEILMVHEGHTIIEMCEALASRHKEVILMLDWDRKGRQLTERIRRILMTEDIKVNEEFMGRIFFLVCKETKEVEALDGLMVRLRKLGERKKLPLRPLRD